MHGYSDVAEEWFIEAMKTIPGWQVIPDSLDLGNANDTFVVMRDVSGAYVPHVYENARTTSSRQRWSSAEPLRVISGGPGSRCCVVC